MRKIEEVINDMYKNSKDTNLALNLLNEYLDILAKEMFKK